MAKTEKICIVCGNKFNGTAKAECCGSNCRVKLKRLLEKGEQPKFRLVGGKNTVPKEPEINAQDFTKQTNDIIPITAPKPVTNYTIKKRPEAVDSTTDIPQKKAPEMKPYMSDAIRKKLGW